VTSPVTTATVTAAAAAAEDEDEDKNRGGAVDKRAIIESLCGKPPTTLLAVRELYERLYDANFVQSLASSFEDDPTLSLIVSALVAHNRDEVMHRTDYDGGSAEALGESNPPSFLLSSLLSSSFLLLISALSSSALLSLPPTSAAEIDGCLQDLTPDSQHELAMSFLTHSLTQVVSPPLPCSALSPLPSSLSHSNPISVSVCLVSAEARLSSLRGDLPQELGERDQPQAPQSPRSRSQRFHLLPCGVPCSPDPRQFSLLLPSLLLLLLPSAAVLLTVFLFPRLPSKTQTQSIDWWEAPRRLSWQRWRWSTKSISEQISLWTSQTPSLAKLSMSPTSLLGSLSQASLSTCTETEREPMNSSLRVRRAELFPALLAAK
jgi:hypothetical protein